MLSKIRSKTLHEGLYDISHRIIMFDLPPWFIYTEAGTIVLWPGSVNL